MIISDDVKRILQHNDFSRQTNSSLSQNTMDSKKTLYKEYSKHSSPGKRKILKLKNNLIGKADNSEIRKYYFPNALAQDIQLSQEQVQTSDEKRNLFPNIIQEQNGTKTLYQQIIELFPIEHDIWIELVDKNSTIEDVVNNNPEYFQGLLNICTQEQQLKIINDDKIGQKKLTTQYNRTYCQPKTQDQPLLNQSKAYEQYQSQYKQLLQKYSVYNQNYIPLKYEKVDNCKPEFNPNLNQSTFLSTYNSSFMNWKPQYHGKVTQQLSPKQQSTLPFIAETNYSKDFKQIKTEKAELQKHIKLGPFVENGQSLIKESTSQHFYQSHYSVPSKLIRPVSPRLFSTKQSFEGQYTTSFNKSYISKNTNTESQHSSFADKFYDCTAIKSIFDKKIKTRIF